MKEPSVSIKMVVENNLITTVDNENIAAGVIVAECGTTQPMLFNSSTLLLMEYTKDGKIRRDTDPTLIHAAAIADIMPVFVKRVYNNTDKDGHDKNLRAGLIIKYQASDKTHTDAGYTTTTSLFRNNIPVLKTTDKDGTISYKDNKNETEDLIYIIAKNPAVVNTYELLSFEISDLKTKNGNFTTQMVEVQIKTSRRTYDYDGSLEPDYINNSGLNQFIENINDYENTPFEIHVVKKYEESNNSGNYVVGTLLDNSGISFGGDKELQGNVYDTSPFTGAAPTVKDGAQISDFKNAFAELMDDDNYKPTFGLTLGYQNHSYAAYINTFCEKKWFTEPFGLIGDPLKKKTPDIDAIKGLKPTINSNYFFCMAPYDLSTLMTDWITPMSLEVAYLRKIQSNKAKSAEFAPMIGKVNSVLSITKPSVILKKSVRQELLDYDIMSLVWRTNENRGWLNKNICCGDDNILNQEQNIRLACKINRDLDTILEPYIGQYNILQTRNKVLTAISQYFKNNITNQLYSIDGYNMVCDESNNDAHIRAAGQLVVDLYVTYLSAITEVLVYHRAIDVATNTDER